MPTLQTMQDLLIRASDGSVALLGGRHKSSGHVRFPSPVGIDAENYDPIALPKDGTLWSFTLQTYPPNTPPYRVDEEGEFCPFVVGYVELPGAAIVQSRIVTSDPSSLRIGMPMTLTSTRLAFKDRGEVDIFAFRPLEHEHEGSAHD